MKLMEIGCKNIWSVKVGVHHRNLCSHLSTSDSFFLFWIAQQHFSVRTANKMNRVRRRIVKTDPTTTAMAIKISGERCSGKSHTSGPDLFANFITPLRTLSRPSKGIKLAPFTVMFSLIFAYKSLT